MRVMQTSGGPALMIASGILTALLLLSLTFLFTALGVFFLRRSRQPLPVVTPPPTAPTPPAP
jgi:hypothetical protein